MVIYKLQISFQDCISTSYLSTCNRRIIAGYPHVVYCIDDVLMADLTEEEHLQNLTQGFYKLQDHRMQVKREKYICLLSINVEYLGCQINANGVHTTCSKLQAIQQASSPKNVTELQAFLSLLNCYKKFIPNLSTMIHLSNALLRQVRWKWTQECADTFKKTKQFLS